MPSSKKAIYINDASLSFAVISDLITFKEHARGMLDFPAHHYFVSADYSRCIVFTAEGDMDFAMSHQHLKSQTI